MPARLWEAAKHGARGTIPQWVRAAPDAGATAPPRIGQIARRAAQVAAAAGVVGGGIGVGIGATEVASRPVDLAHSGGATGACPADHISTYPGTGSPASSDSGGAPGPPGSASEGGVTLHTSGDGGHLATGLATTWRIPGHGAVGGEHGEDGAEGGHDGLTIEMYQDVVVHEGADGMYSVDAVEYVVVRDEHGHAYVFSENYHTVVPDPPGQETDLVIHETDRVQVVEHPDGSFSVTQADNSISVTVGPDGDGHNEVTVTESESVQIGHDPNADGHDTASLTENEYGATTSDQTEVVTEQTVPPTTGTHQPSASVPQPTAAVGVIAGGDSIVGADGLRGGVIAEGTAAPSAAPETFSAAASSAAGAAGAAALSAAPETFPAAVSSPAGAALSAAPASTAASSQVGTAPSTPPETFPTDRVMSTAPPLATSLGVAATTAGGLTSGHEPDSPGAFPGLRGGPAEPGRGAAPAGHFPNEPVPAQHPAGGAFDSTSGSAASRPFEHPTTEPPADAPRPDPHHGAAFAGHDQPGLDEPGAHADIGLAAVDPTEPEPSADAHSVGEHEEEASGAHPDSSAGSAHAPSGHDPGTDTTVIH